MVQIIAILLVAFILIPLVELTLKERILYGVKLLIYLIAALWIIWTTFVGVKVV